MFKKSFLKNEDEIHSISPPHLSLNVTYYLAREPRIQIVLLDGRVVQMRGRNGHHPVGKTQQVVKFARIFEHLLLHFHGSRQVVLANHELFDFVELVHAEDALHVLAP
jgi:hypothetical protein